MFNQSSAAVPCPKCGRHTLDIVESRPSGDSRRRRKLCRSCGHRLGSREVSEEWYAQALSDRALLQRIRADLSLVAPAPTAADDEDPCLLCIHRLNDTCDLGFPEFSTPEARDCSAMQQSGEA